MTLGDLFSSMTTAERDQLARDAGTNLEYLRQVATRWRGARPSLALIGRLAKADPRLSLADMAAEFTE